MVGNREDPETAGEPSRIGRVYDEIAPHFSETRRHPWPEVEAFVESVPASECGIDLGCGNGRHLPVLSTRAAAVVGVDLSRGLLLEAAERAEAASSTCRLVQGDAAALPLADGSVDVALYVATLHHLSGRPRRRRSLAELARVLAPDGRALVSAWSTAHDRFDAPDASEGFDTTVDWTLPGGETVPRYYHIYAPPEFDADLRASPLALEESYVSSGNCYAEVSGTEGKHP